MHSNSLLTLAAAGALLSSSALAQNDECITAIAVTYGSATPFDTTTATPTVMPAWSCAGPSVAPDLWYSMTATAADDIIFDTCGSGFDTALEVYDGTCGTLTSIACNDDACGTQSSVTITATIGTTYYVRVGGFLGVFGVGALHVSDLPAPPTTVSIIDTIPGTWVDISGTGTALGLDDDGEVDITTTVGNAVLAAGTVRVGSNGGARFDGDGTDLGALNNPILSTLAFGQDRSLLGFWDDIDSANGMNGEIYWEEIGGTLIIQWNNVGFWSSSDTVSFQIQVHASGPALAQFIYDDVSSPRASGGDSATIGFQSGDPGGFDDFEWSFDTAGAVADGDVLSVVLGSGPIGNSYCMANNNSTGVAASMSATGSDSITSNNLTLVGSDLPLNAFGFFLSSPSQGFTTNPGGSEGNLCLGGAIGRFVGPGQIQNSGALGEITLLTDNTAIPTPNGPVSVMAGSVLNFQAWFRDAAAGGGATSNFTDGLEVTFTN